MKPNKKTNIKAAITAVGGYVPEDFISNKDLEKMVDTNDEWITARTGIKKRRILKEKGKGTSFLAINAAKDLLSKRKIDPETIDLVIVSTITPDFHVASTAPTVASAINAKNAYAYDLSAACSGFLYGMSTATSFIESGRYKKVLIIGADMMSSIVDYTDRSTSILFGDGAGAVMLEPSSEGLGVQDSILKSDGSGGEFLHMKAGGSARPASHETVQAREHHVWQDGQAVFKAAVTSMADVSAEIMQKNNLEAKDVSWLVPHQANQRIILGTAKKLGIDIKKTISTVNFHANTSAASIPLAISHAFKSGKIKKNDIIALCAIGGGLTWGSCILKV